MKQAALGDEGADSRVEYNSSDAVIVTSRPEQSVLQIKEDSNSQHYNARSQAALNLRDDRKQDQKQPRDSKDFDQHHHRYRRRRTSQDEQEEEEEYGAS